jgi:hypothetical protein
VRATQGKAPALGVPTPAGALALDSALVRESTGGPIVGRGGEPVAMAVVVRNGATALPWKLVQERIAELKPGPRTIYVGWRDQYRCVGRMHAYARAAHPGFDPRATELNRAPSVSRLPGTEDMDQ